MSHGGDVIVTESWILVSVSREVARDALVLREGLVVDRGVEGSSGGRVEDRTVLHHRRRHP